VPLFETQGDEGGGLDEDQNRGKGGRWRMQEKDGWYKWRTYVWELVSVNGFGLDMDCCEEFLFCVTGV